MEILVDLVDLSQMLMPMHQHGSIYEARYERNLALWVVVCQKIIAKNSNVKPPPKPLRNQDQLRRGQLHKGTSMRRHFSSLCPLALLMAASAAFSDDGSR